MDAQPLNLNTLPPTQLAFWVYHTPASVNPASPPTPNCSDLSQSLVGPPPCSAPLYSYDADSLSAPSGASTTNPASLSTVDTLDPTDPWFDSLPSPEAGLHYDLALDSGTPCYSPDPCSEKAKIRKERRREQNRAAQRAYRFRQEQTIQKLQEETERLGKENAELKRSRLISPEAIEITKESSRLLLCNRCSSSVSEAPTLQKQGPHAG